MSSIELQPATSKKSKQKTHASLRIDMTPMVDLGFLLISFFIFTTTMSEKRALKLVMPKDGEQMPVPASKALTVLLSGDNKVYAYEGRWEDAVGANKIITTSYNENEGIGNLIRIKQKWLEQFDNKEGRTGLVLLIKAGNKSSYRNMIDALDEALINHVTKYMLADLSTEEKNFIEKKG